MLISVERNFSDLAEHMHPMANLRRLALCHVGAGVFSMVAGLAPGVARSGEIWFAPSDNLARGGRVMDADFPHLFDEPPSWNTRIDVFQMTPFYARTAPDADLVRLRAFLDRHHIALAVASQPMQLNGECDMGEGRIRPGVNLRTFRRLRDLGLNVRYVALDEPLTFGHFFSRGARPCLLPIDDVARRVALTINEIKQSYPNANIVDYEAPPDISTSEWTNALDTWLEAYRSYTGLPLYAVVFDVNWRRSWREPVRQGVASLRAHGVRPGMFLTIAGPGTSDESAVMSLKDNISAVEDAGLPLSMVVLACWTPFPTHSLPASDPTSLTSVLGAYLARQGR
jgi:hypothetical protein